MVNQAQIKRLASAEKLRAFVDPYQHGATRSALEDLLFDVCREHGWPLPLINEVVDGVECDFVFGDLRTIVQADGWAFHFTRIAFEDDHAIRLYLESRGHRVIAVTQRQVKARATRAQLAAVLASSGRPWPR